MKAARPRFSPLTIPLVYGSLLLVVAFVALGVYARIGSILWALVTFAIGLLVALMVTLAYVQHALRGWP